MLNVFPKPNFFDRTISAGAYNYVFQSRAELPQRMDTLKLDYHLNSANVLSVNVSTHSDITRGWRPNGGNWPQVNNTYDYLARVYTARYQRIFSPAVINEFNVGYSRAEGVDTNIDEAVRQNQRDTAGFKLGQFNPSSNPMRLLPDATFGGVSGAAQLSIAGQFPLGGPNQVLTFTDNLSIAHGPHMFKVGIYVDRVTRNVSTDGTFHGSFDFGNNANNPLNSGYAYANAALGVFNSYSETSRRFFPRYLLRNSEWFAQDNWRINRRLTLDYGMRFAIVSPASEMDDLLSGFVAAQYSPAGRVQLVRPIMADGRKSGINPVTGEVLPATVIGAIAPGAGVAANGMISPSTDAGYPRGLTNGRGVQFGPRLGFAFDPEGKGAMAIRGGFGMFYNRQSVASTVQRYTGQPPLVNTPVIYFGTMPTLLSSAGWLFPQNVNGVDRSGEIPCVMNYSLSVQRKIGRGTVVDVAYVGSLGRHLMWARDINSIPFGTNFDPRNADPTNTKTPLPAAFLRPIPGYGQISIADSGASSNYHSLQVSANRRFSHNLEFGAAWTWSKAMDFNDNDTDLISTQVPVRVWNYGMAAFDRTHTLRANWLWEVPAPGWRSLPARAMLRNWQVSGIASFISGAPQNVTFSTTTAMDITGSSTDGARVVVTGNPVLPKGERSFERFFRTDVFQLPARGSIGNSARTLFRGPGINSWDLAVFRNFPVREKMRLQFRWELYNAFNHTQFNNLDRNARFDPQGNQINARFGQLTAARPARIMQFAARFYF